MSQGKSFVAGLTGPVPVELLTHEIEDTVGPVWNIDRDLRSAQFTEGLSIQNEKERTFVLQAKPEHVSVCLTVIGTGSIKLKLRMTTVFQFIDLFFVFFALTSSQHLRFELQFDRY